MPDADVVSRLRQVVLNDLELVTVGFDLLLGVGKIIEKGIELAIGQQVEVAVLVLLQPAISLDQALHVTLRCRVIEDTDHLASEIADATDRASLTDDQAETIVEVGVRPVDAGDGRVGSIAADNDVRFAGDQSTGQLTVLAGDDFHLGSTEPSSDDIGDLPVEPAVAVSLLHQHRWSIRLGGDAEHASLAALRDKHTTEAQARAAVRRALRQAVINPSIIQVPGVPGAPGSQLQGRFLLARAPRPLADISGHSQHAVRAPIAGIPFIMGPPGGDLPGRPVPFLMAVTEDVDSFRLDEITGRA